LSGSFNGEGGWRNSRYRTPLEALTAIAKWKQLLKAP
jgi:hypothetical protein